MLAFSASEINTVKNKTLSFSFPHGSCIRQYLLVFFHSEATIARMFKKYFELVTRDFYLFLCFQDLIAKQSQVIPKFAALISAKSKMRFQINGHHQKKSLKKSFPKKLLCTLVMSDLDRTGTYFVFRKIDLFSLAMMQT